MLKATYINEIFKISKKKKLIVAGILTACLIVVVSAAVFGIDTLTGIKLASNGNFPLVVLPLFEYALIPLFSAFVCIDMFSGEFFNDSIKLTLMQPASRFKIFTAKTFACATFIGASLIFTMLFSIVISPILGTSLNGVVSCIKAYTVCFVPLMVLGQMVILVSNFSKGSASAFLISVILFIAMKGLELYFRPASHFLFTSGFDWYRLFLGNYTDFGRILRLLLLFCGYELAFFSAGFYFFEKRSI